MESVRHGTIGKGTMRVCMILEGCYPYVFGGVSSWVHHYMQSMPETEFVLWCVGSSAEKRGKFKFTLPDNVVEVHEVFLDDALNLPASNREIRGVYLKEEEYSSVRSLLSGRTADWEGLFRLFQDVKMNPAALLRSDAFMHLLLEYARENYPYLSFTEYFFTIRSMLLPVLYLLTQEIPEADLYHSTSTGYGGVLGSMASWKHKKPFVVTEHGIYTREREEELIRAEWVRPELRHEWIDLFYRFSLCAYDRAAKVTSLFERASRTQAEIGCDEKKLVVIENGINYDRFTSIPLKEPGEWVNIGAVVRIARIKDIKTMIYAFAELKARIDKVRLYILGDTDDEEYEEECHRIIDQLDIKDIIFTGAVDVMKYFPIFDFTILTSISEGQPLSVLESFAAGRPVVATDVGCCRELIEEDGEFRAAGIVVPPMHKMHLANAFEKLCTDRKLCRDMGISGRARAAQRYRQSTSIAKYRKLYQRLLGGPDFEEDDNDIYPIGEDRMGDGIWVI